LISVLLSGYHYGIEKNIFEEFSGCTTGTLEIIDKSELLKSLSDNVTSCKDVNFKLFGSSLAGINFLLSLLIVIYSLKILFYEKN
jgi:disulfide bond formation protein DsbB